MNIKKLLLLLSCIIVHHVTYGRFSDPNLRNYYFAGDFGVQSPFLSNDLKCYYVINSIPNLDLNTNTPIKLYDILGDRVSQMQITNGTTIILKPELDSLGITKEAKQSIYNSFSHVVIEGANDFITVYLYNIPSTIGNKLVFNISAFEDFMMKQPWYKTPPAALGWVFGFEFYSGETDFKGSQPTLFPNLQGIKPFFIDLHYSGDYAKGPWYTYYVDPSHGKFINLMKSLNPYYPAQFFVALGDDGVFYADKWNPNVLFQNNITYIKPLSDDDVIHVQKVLKDGGISLSSN